MRIDGVGLFPSVQGFLAYKRVVIPTGITLVMLVAFGALVIGGRNDIHLKTLSQSVTLLGGALFVGVNGACIFILAGNYTFIVVKRKPKKLLQAQDSFPAKDTKNGIYTVKVSDDFRIYIRNVTHFSPFQQTHSPSIEEKFSGSPKGTYLIGVKNQEAFLDPTSSERCKLLEEHFPYNQQISIPVAEMKDGWYMLNIGSSIKKIEWITTSTGVLFPELKEEVKQAFCDLKLPQGSYPILIKNKIAVEIRRCSLAN